MEQIKFTEQDFQLILESLIEHQHKLYERSYLYRDGADIKSVQLLMRHENVEITLNTYSHLLGSDLEKAVDRIG